MLCFIIINCGRNNYAARIEINTRANNKVCIIKNILAYIARSPCVKVNRVLRCITEKPVRLNKFCRDILMGNVECGRNVSCFCISFIFISFFFVT